MQITDIPTKFVLAFADQASPGYTRSIPLAPTGTAGQASLQQGFPAPNFTPVSAGGVPPFGQDFNGLLHQMSAWNRWAPTGAFPPYDATWQSAVGGYPMWAIVGSLVEFGLLWISTVDNNVTNPDTGGAGWFAWARIVTSNKDLYVNASTGNDNNNGLSPATALATLQGGITRAFNYPPSQFTITLHVADGTYTSWLTPAWQGPNIIIDGNSGTPSNVLINVTSGSGVHCCLVQGPNTVTVQNLKVQNSGSNQSGGFVASNGGSLSTKNTVNGPISSGAIFEGFGGGQVLLLTNHVISGGASSCFFGLNGGQVQLASNININVSTPVSIGTFAVAGAQGVVFLNTPPNATFTGSAVTGTRYQATLNGVISVNGGGANVFPGSIAGSTSTGGQYA